MEDGGAPKPSCTRLELARATLDKRAGLGSGLVVRVVLNPPSSDKPELPADAVKIVQGSLSFLVGLEVRGSPKRFDKLEVPVDATERGLSGVFEWPAAIGGRKGIKGSTDSKRPANGVPSCARCEDNIGRDKFNTV